jgi:hypothetical protein
MARRGAQGPRDEQRGQGHREFESANSISNRSKDKHICKYSIKRQMEEAKHQLIQKFGCDIFGIICQYVPPAIYPFRTRPITEDDKKLAKRRYPFKELKNSTDTIVVTDGAPADFGFIKFPQNAREWVALKTATDAKFHEEVFGKEFGFNGVVSSMIACTDEKKRKIGDKYEAEYLAWRKAYLKQYEFTYEILEQYYTDNDSVNCSTLRESKYGETIMEYKLPTMSYFQQTEWIMMKSYDYFSKNRESRYLILFEATRARHVGLHLCIFDRQTKSLSEIRVKSYPNPVRGGRLIFGPDNTHFVSVDDTWWFSIDLTTQKGKELYGLAGSKIVLPISDSEIYALRGTRFYQLGSDAVEYLSRAPHAPHEKNALWHWHQGEKSSWIADGKSVIELRYQFGNAFK